MRTFVVLQLCVFLAVSPVSHVFAQEPPPAPGEPSPAAPTEAPTPEAKPEKKPPEEGEKVPPRAPVALPGSPEPEDVLDFQAPQLTAPAEVPPGLTDRFQRRLDLVQPGQVLFDLTVEEVYDTNAFNSSTDPQDDFITVIVPGIAVEQVAKNASLRLRYTPRINIYNKFSEQDRVNHTLAFAGSWDPTPGVRLYLRDDLLITDRSEEASALGISQTGTRTTTQNNLAPGAEFRLGPEDDLVTEYTNTIIDGGGDDRTINGGRIAWRHRLPRAGVSLEYIPAYVDRESGGNSFNHTGTLRSSYRLNPRSELLFRVFGSYTDNDVGDNTAFVGGDVGINHQLTPNLHLRLTAGPQVFGLEQGDPKPRFFTDSNLAWTFPRGTLTVGLVQRYANTFSTVNDEGVVLDTRGLGSFAYQLAPRLSFSVNGSYGRVEFQDQDRTDDVGRVGIDIRYQIWQNLFLTAGYTLFDRNSTVDTEDLNDQRVFIGLSLNLSTPI